MILRQGFFRDLPWERELYDYGSRTDGQPVYFGHNKVTSETSDPKWVMFFLKYNDDGTVAEKYSLEGAWDNRVALFAEYV